MGTLLRYVILAVPSSLGRPEKDWVNNVPFISNFLPGLNPASWLCFIANSLLGFV